MRKIPVPAGHDPAGTEYHPLHRLRHDPHPFSRYGKARCQRGHPHTEPVMIWILLLYRYGDTIKVSATEAKKDYSLRKSGASVKYEKVWDDFDLEEQQRSPAAILIPRMKKNRLCIR